MDAYFNEHKSKEPLSVLRGIPDQERAQKMIKSGVFQDKGYVSTSTDVQTAEEFADTAALKDRYVFALRVHISSFSTPLLSNIDAIVS